MQSSDKVEWKTLRKCLQVSWRPQQWLNSSIAQNEKHFKLIRHFLHTLVSHISDAQYKQKKKSLLKVNEATSRKTNFMFVYEKTFAQPFYAMLIAGSDNSTILRLRQLPLIDMRKLMSLR